jgi:hypothetical protein
MGLSTRIEAWGPGQFLVHFRKRSAIGSMPTEFAGVTEETVSKLARQLDKSIISGMMAGETLSIFE